MSAYEMNKLMFDAHHNSGLIDEFKQNPDSLLARYELTDSEKEALRSVDQLEILRRGGHTLLTLLFVRKNGILSDFDHAVSHDVNPIKLRYG